MRQTRELSGGDGWLQDELVVHFGLGPSTVVDELEIRWPAGQVDVLTGIPADQEIRVIEGRGAWYPAPRTVWEAPPLRWVDHGQEVAAVCRPALFEPTAQITRITGDPRDVEVLIEQETSLGRHWINLSRNVEVKGYPVTAVLETQTAALPAGFSLSQNYPNPFNSETTIRFALPQSGEVELAVYNLAGQGVATLAQGRREAGAYAVRWDGRDDQGRELASGVYLYRLQAGQQQVETRKLALVR